MSNEANCVDPARLRRPAADGTVERQHLYTVISQVEELQRRGETDPGSALLEIIKTNVVSIPGA